MHFQWCNPRRIRAKHVWYRMTEQLRWPGRKTPRQLNEMYDEALKFPLKVTEVRPEFYAGLIPALIKTDGACWHETEIHRMLIENGPIAFKGLDLKGYA